MKNKLIIIAFAILTPFLILNFYYPQEETKQTSPPLPYTDKFLIGSMQSYIDLTNYDAAGFNTVHQYISEDSAQFPGNPTRHTPKSWITGGEGLFAPVPTATIRTKISEMYQHNQSRFIWQRPKIEWLAFGQSSIYQAEPIEVNDNYWFYSFNVSNGSPENENGNWVLHCSGINSGPNAGFVLKGLKANTEQCRRTNNDGNEWAGDTECDWFVKPKIRIPASIPQTHPELEVCTIYVIDQNNQQKITPFTIKAKHFHQFNNPNPYDGSYLEEFYFRQTQNEVPSGISYTGDLGYDWAYNARGTRLNDTGLNNKADIQVYWHDNCDIWIDYVKVENDIADGLMNPNNPLYTTYNDWITEEANAVNVDPYVYNFYTELFEFNNIPCMAYVNHKIDSITNGKINYMADQLTFYQYHLPFNDRGVIDHPDKLKTMFFDVTGIRQVYVGDPYPLTAGNPAGCYQTSEQFSRVPQTLNIPSQNLPLILAQQTSPANYDAWLQSTFDTVCSWYEGGNFNEWNYHPLPLKGSFMYLMKRGNAVSRSCNIPFIAMLQGHQWMSSFEVDREPTNEELDVMTNIAVSYGAKGIIFWWLPSTGNPSVDPCTYSFGFVNTNGHQRTENVYGQNKWNKLTEITTRLKDWGPTLMSFDNTQTSSYIYRFERISCLDSTYFSDVISYKPGTGMPACNEDAPGGDVPPSLVYDCNQERYLQVSTFRKSAADPFDKYFMIVNKRCSPVQADYNDGRRDIRVAFDINSSELPTYTTWKITEILSSSEVGRFNKYLYNNYVDLGWFNPGEGKIYKLSPVMISGGELAGDEIISGESFTCEAPVYNNGHNITIGANTTIHFNDSSKFVMSGGVFTVGDQNTSAPQNITSDAVPGGSWRGHSFTNCEVRIYGATFNGLANDTTYAVNIIDCPVVDIRNCTFNTNSSLKGGVNAICFDNPFIAINNIYIGSNTFNSAGSTIPTLNVSSYAGVTTPLIIENNIFNEGNTAVFLTSVIGGAIKGNTINDNYIGINALTSSIDVVQNNISSTVNGSMGFFAAGGSELKLNSSGAFTLGGLNNISNEGTGTNNINVDGSYFLLDDGENIFNISSDQSSYHLYGYFPMFTAVTTEETNNCFKVNSSPVDPPLNMVTSGYQGTQITFNFNPYLSGCEIIGGGDGLAINLGDGIYDTIYTGGSGSGGSMKEALPLDKGEYSRGLGREGVGNQIPLSRGVTAEGSRGVFVITSAKQKYDSISVLMRYRNYTQAKTKCLDLINTYPDSIQSIFAVSKLFLATVANDTSYNASNTLKIFYENLILNHPDNTSLVKRANYYILKCKVRMREYSQALAGFQQIINQNPYSYEGLIARWDYMATSLLAPQGGSFGSEPTVSVRDDDSRLSIDIVNALQNEAEDDDKSPFSKEQRQDIRKSINTAIEISKNDDETKIKKLEEKSELGDVNASKELTQMKSLKQVVKTEKPKSIIEHVRIVSEDIRKVFGTNTSSKGNEPKNIPLIFRISQNYPNPFNPVTKINYDLPKDSKVKIVIYDILGREVKRLVNNELKTAGSYIVDFNASNYASGVYFYRIEAEETNGNKFVDSKKMVLLK